MQKISTMQTNAKNIFEGQLTSGLDLGNRSSAYCVLNETGEIVGHAQKVRLITKEPTKR